MKKVMIYGLFLVVLSGISCGKDDDPSNGGGGDGVASLEVVVKDANGATEPHIKVYLFSSPASETAGKNPSGALKTATTGEDGIAEFNLTNVSPGTVYITVLEEVFTDNQSVEQVVLGSAEVTIEKGKELERELVLTSPRSLEYDHGFIPTAITSKLAMDEYKRWRQTQLVACNGGLRPTVTGELNITKVEAVGFGMLLAAYAKDKETLDGLFTFYKSKRTPEANNMMAWNVPCEGFTDDAGHKGSATDGDIDVAFGLIVASKLWPEESYLEDAIEIIEIVKESVVVSCPGVNNTDGVPVHIVGPGYNNTAWGGCGMMDIMYHTPAFFRIFADVTGDADWDKIANDTYVTLNNGAHEETGLVPDWQTASGTPGPGGRAGHFGYDACRAPWRITLDYLWNGNQKADEWADKVSTWANGVGPANIVDGYELDGRARGQYVNSAFVGGFTVATMAKDQNTVNNFSTVLKDINDDYWFNLNTRVLYLFTLTGNFWDPSQHN